MEPESDTIRHLKKKDMLEALARLGNVSAAAKSAGIHRDTHYQWQKEDAEYASAADSAIEEAAEWLEAEARRRAVEGVEESVYQGGNEVGKIRRYSDTLLIFLLKGAKPEKYRERTDVNHSGSVAVQSKSPVDMTDFTENEIDEFERLTKKARGITD